MTFLRDNSVAGAGDRHFSRLKGRVVRRGKRPVGREATHSGIAKVTLDQGTQIIKLLLARRVPLNAPRV